MTSDPNPPTGQQTDRPWVAHAADGKFTSTTDSAARDARAAQLYCDGWSYRRIAAELGWDAHSTAQDAVARGLRAIRSVGVAEARTAALERLQASREAAAAMEAEALALLGRTYLAVNKDGVIRDPRRAADRDGEDGYLEDAAPKLAAIDRVVAARRLGLALDEREAKLLGLDAPAQQQIALDGGLRYEIVGVSLDEIIGEQPAAELGGDGEAG